MKLNRLIFSLLSFLAAFSVAGYCQTVLMNEVYSRGTNGTAGDWIEVYNASAQPVDITGYKIYDSGGQTGSKPKKAFPSGTTIPAKGFYVIVVDTTISGDLSGFGLSSGGEWVWLENASGAVIDSVNFVYMGVDTSYARKPDGTNSWSLISPVTRGFSNSSTVIQPSIVLNEVYSRGTAGTAGDWIEVFNPTTLAQDISGFKIYDSGARTGTKPKKQIPAGTTIPAKGFYVIVVDTTISQDSSGFGLSTNGETVWLENTAGVIIDSIAFPYMGVDSSYGRKPDGTAAWIILKPVTRGSSNTVNTVSAPIVMNEIYSRGTAGTAGDWIEIYNSTNQTVDISGFKIYDSGGQTGSKPKKVIPAGTSLPAKGFYVVVVDTTISGDLSGFGLSSTGEWVWLENSTGTIIDSVSFPYMGIDSSYGRRPDGGNWALLTTLSRGASNGSSGINREITVTNSFALEQNYPNPFNPSTTIRFTTFATGLVNLVVFNQLGQQVAVLLNSEIPAGGHAVQFNAAAMASGVYYYQLSANGSNAIRKMIVLK